MAGAGARLIGSVLLAGTPVVHASSALGTLVVSAPLPGFASAPPGPTNGPLTASSFASQSSDPKVAASEFERAAAEPGFGAYLRLWTSTDAAAPSANDVAVELFRIPDHGRETTMLSELRQAYLGSGTSAFAVPGIPGAEGRSVSATQPIAANLRVVTFATGPYVAVVQVAARTAQNPSPVGAAQAIAVSTSEYEILSGTPAPSTAPGSRPVPEPAGTATRAPGSSALWLVLEVVAALVVAGVLAVVAWRRRRSLLIAVGRFPESATARPRGEPADPWGPDGIFAAMGAVVPGERRTASDADGGAGTTPATTVVQARGDDGLGGPDGRGARDEPAPADAEEPVAHEELEAVAVWAATRSSSGGAPRDGAVGEPADTARHGSTVTASTPTAPAARQAAPAARPDEPAPGTPAAWLPDPSGEPDQLRYWDGLAWTSHVARRTPVP